MPLYTGGTALVHLEAEAVECWRLSQLKEHEDPHHGAAWWLARWSGLSHAIELIKGEQK